jgi:hypothetical protein
MDEFIDIPEGRQDDYLVHGVVVLAAGGLLLLVHWSLTIVMVALAVALFRVGSGIEIDPVGKRVRVYKTLGTLRVGSWLLVHPYHAIVIRYTNESQVMNSRGSSTNVRVRTYDLHFIGPGGATALLHEFNDYTKARKSAETMARLWSMQIADEVQERRLRAQVRGTERRR